MKIYSSEKAIANLIEADCLSKLTSSIKVESDKPELLIASLRKGQKDGFDTKVGQAIAKLTEPQHQDLMYGSAILVSSVMNRNDDVFLPDELWPAKETPVNTPYNDQHVETDIIGHIIAARPIDKDGNEIQGSDVPNYLDIEVDFVIYKAIFPLIAKDIYENAPKGKKFVSMEARFNNFDYALFPSDDLSTAEIVTRNEQTAFLTKHLRAYGGDGTYQGYKKIGRVLRNIRFVGMGNVDAPANPTSEYTKFDNYEMASKSFKESKTLLLVKGYTMKKIETMEDAQALITELQAKLQTLETEKAESETNKKVNELTEQLNVANTNKDAALTKVSEFEKQVNDLKAELKTTKDELQSKTEELNKRDAEIKANKRLATLKEIGYEVGDEAKKAKILAMSDESFETVVEFTKSLPKPTDKKEQTPEEIAEAEKKAKDELDKAQQTNKGGTSVEKTEGDSKPSDAKISEVAELLVASVMGRTKKSGKSKKSE